MNLQALVIWYLVLQGFMLAGTPLTLSWLRHLPSRGYALSKALGLLFSGVFLWWGATLRLWPNTAAAAIAAATLLLGLGLWRLRREGAALRAWWHTHFRFVLVTEALFTLGFCAWAAVRASQPQIATAGGEKWMEIAFLNAILRSPSMPPHDPWLSGFAISYYYLGYLLLGMLTQVTQLPATIAFNLGNASWFALVAVGAYGLVYDLTEGGRPFKALFAPLLLLITGNASGLLQLLYWRGLLPSSFWRWLDLKGLNTPPPAPGTWMTPQHFDWWQASRVLHDYAPFSTPQNPISQEVIDEFPAFSFILGDMHPHLLALPFVLLALGLALNLWKAPSNPEAETSRSWQARLTTLAPWVGMAAVLGALGFLNTWDFPIYWALIVAVMFLKHRQDVPESSLGETVLAVSPGAVALALGSVLLYGPFWFALRSQAGGLLPNVFNATRLPQFLVMFAPLAVPVVGVTWRLGKTAGIRWQPVLGWSLLLIGILTLVGLIVGWIIGNPYLQSLLQGRPLPGIGVVEAQAIFHALRTRLLNPWTALLLTCGVVTLVSALLTAQRHLTGTSAFIGLLILLGLGLTLAPEYVFLKDVFHTRMNTIFKFYFQAWVLWSLAGAWWLAEARYRDSGWLKRSALLAAWILIASGWLYTGFAIPARAAQNRSFYGGHGTLDGAAWLAEREAADWEAIRWLNAHVTGRPVIVEAPGDRYRAYIYEGRIAAFTGLPTVLGWGGHQSQWRGNYDAPAERETMLEALFTTSDLSLTRTLLAQYDITYIIVGQPERIRYPTGDFAKFAALFPAVFQNAEVTIYQVTGP